MVWLGSIDERLHYLCVLIPLDAYTCKTHTYIIHHAKNTYRFLSHNTFTGNEWAPLNLAMLTNLEELTISHCAITSLPETIGTLQSLRSLDVKANQLEVLISSLSALTNLQTLQV